MVDVWPFDVRTRSVRDGVAVVSVVGEVDLATALPLRTALAPLLSNPAVRLVICDLSTVSFFACSGVTVMLDAHETLKARGARLRLVVTSRPVLTPLSVTGAADVLAISHDLTRALD